MIRPEGERNWMIVAGGGAHTCQVNDILSLLCKEHFHGLVEYAGVTRPAYSFDHYAAAPDAEDRANRRYNNKAKWVKQELWDFFKCLEGYEARPGQMWSPKLLQEGCR